METPFVSRLPATVARTRTQCESSRSIGPTVVAAGLRSGRSCSPTASRCCTRAARAFWWLLIEPPLLVVGAGIVFALLVARPLLADLEEHDAAAR